MRKCDKRISVILPVYNAEKYIEYCLNSILSNTYTNLEILCVNDASTDASLQILQKFQTKDNRIVIINQETNLGVSVARNVGMKRATGDYIAFIDSDDQIHPQYFESLIYWANEKNADMIACRFASRKSLPVSDFLKYVPEEIPIHNMSLEQQQEDYQLRRYMCGRIFRKDFLEGSEFDKDIKLAEDQLFLFNLAWKKAECKSFVVEVPLYNYLVKERIGAECYPPLATMLLAPKYKEVIRECQNEVLCEYAMTNMLRMLLACRYTLRFYPEYKNQQLECSRQLKDLLRSVNKEKLLGVKKRISFIVLVNMPLCYRLFRIAKSPAAMLRYEKGMRKLMKNK